MGPKTSRSELPLVSAAAVLAGGSLLNLVSVSGTILAAFLGIGLVVWFVGEWRQWQYRRLLFFWVCFLIGVVLSRAAAPEVLWAGQQGTWEGQIVAVDCSPYNVRVTADFHYLGRAAVEFSRGHQFAEGDYLTVQGFLKRPRTAPNAGEFDLRRYLRSQNVYWLIMPSAWAVQPGSARGAFWDRAKEQTAQKLRRLPDPSLVMALLLGDRTGISEQVRTAWERLGISHLMAISGMHMGLLAGLLWFALYFVPLSRTKKWLATAVVLLAYTFVIGSRVSAVRAWAIFGLSGVADVRGIRADPLHYWTVVFLSFLLIQPGVWDDVGFQLSFAASGGILLYLPGIKKLPRRLQPGAVSLAAQVSLFPFLVSIFGEVSLVAAAATLLFLPAISAIMAGGVLWLATGGILNVPCIVVLDALTRLIYWASTALAPWALVWTPPPLSWKQWLLWYGVFIACGFLLRRRHLVPPRQTLSRSLLIFAVALLFFALPKPWTVPLQVTAIDVGQGDSVLIRTPYGHTILIDGGGQAYAGGRDYDVGRRRLLPYLGHVGIERIDLVVLSHPHEDHVGGLVAVVESLPVGMVWDIGAVHASPSYERFLDVIAAEQIPYYTPRAGDQLIFPGSVVIDVLHPAFLLSGTGSDLNNNSLVLLLEYQGRRFLFTGDLEVAGQLNLLARGQPAADWLKVPHHGSRSSWLLPWYEAVNPKMAVISAGRHNIFGHPHEEVLAGLAALGVEVYRTDLQGGISFFVWNRRLWAASH